MGVRVSAVQYQLHTIGGFDEFANRVRHYVAAASEFNADIVVFPEFMTTQLLSIGASGIDRLPTYTEGYTQLFSGLAQRTGMHLLGGTHVGREGDKLFNAAYLFYPDGRVGVQKKLHITPTEREEWGVAPGDGLELFDTAFGRIAILTCYDIEFPEIARIARARGADILFCPSCTDDRHGFNRVRYCCHARAVENQVYVVHTGTVGSLPTVDFMRMNYGRAALIAPNDVPFPPDGIIAEGETNQDMIVTGDLHVELLRKVRESGSVTTWRDRRTDLYTGWE